MDKRQARQVEECGYKIIVMMGCEPNPINQGHIIKVLHDFIVNFNMTDEDRKKMDLKNLKTQLDKSMRLTKRLEADIEKVLDKHPETD